MRTDQELNQLMIANQTFHKELQRSAVTVDYFRGITTEGRRAMRDIALGSDGVSVTVLLRAGV